VDDTTPKTPPSRPADDGLAQAPPRRRLWKPIPRPRPNRDLPPRRRVERWAADLTDGVRDGGFATLIHRLDESPILPVDRLELFTDGNHALPRMIAAIEAAREEVLLQSYIFKDDATGRSVVDALGRAVERGVVVRVIADALGSLTTREAFWRELERRRIAFRLFHPLLRYPWRLLIRDHRKILVVDRRVAFTGGMNIGEEYGSGLPPRRRPRWRDPLPPRPRRPLAVSARPAAAPPGPASRSAATNTWRDTHLEVEGPAAWEMAVVFRESWTRADGAHFDLPSLTEPVDTAADGSGAVSGARCLVLDSRPGRGHRETALVLRALVAAARRRVWITNAYFAPSFTALRALCRAARRGVDVRLLLPGESDVPRLQDAARGSYARLMRHGVRVFEYQPAVLHAKTVVVDGHVSVVGSSNLDFRSFTFNGECNLVVLADSAALRLEEAFETDLTRAHEIDPAVWARRPWLVRLREAFFRWLSPLL
jgi:cardiolipin synthase